MPPPRTVRREPYSYLHRDTIVEGDVIAGGRLRVDGTVRGAVRADGVLEVAPEGCIDGGPVRAPEVRIAGTVVGNVHAEGRAEIWRGARVEGDVHAASLDVEEGARFRGRSVMRGDDEPASPLDANDLATDGASRTRTAAAPSEAPGARADSPHGSTGPRRDAGTPGRDEEPVG